MLLRDGDRAVRQPPPLFGVGDLRRLYEAHWGVRINPSNFARQVLQGSSAGFLEEVEQNKGDSEGPRCCTDVAPALHPCWPQIESGPPPSRLTVWIGAADRHPAVATWCMSPQALTKASSTSVSGRLTRRNRSSSESGSSER